MRLYHASTVVVDRPVIMNRFKTLDFGTGFYTTANETQAQDFAAKVFLRRGRQGIPTVNIYECDWQKVQSSLNIIYFAEPDEAWLDFVVHNRRLGRDVGLGADVIVGPVADDDVFATITLFEQGVIGRQDAIAKFKVKKLFNQYLFCNTHALSYLSFMKSYTLGAQA